MKQLGCWIVAAVVLSACGEKPQTATVRKADDKPWELTQTQYAAGGFKPGDKALWEQQLKSRAMSQNEYNRVPPR